MGIVAVTTMYLVKKIRAKTSSNPVEVVHSLNELRAESDTDAGQIEELHTSDEVASGLQGQHNVVFISD